MYIKLIKGEIEECELMPKCRRDKLGTLEKSQNA